MKKLLIIGARGLGRDLFGLANNAIGYKSEFIVKGFLDDKKDALKGYDNYPPIVSSVENYEIQPEDVFVCALGNVHYKRKYIDMIKDRGGDFYTLIHKTAIISTNTDYGEGCVFKEYACISCDVKIGDFNTFMPFSIVGHDCVIGDCCHLDSYAFIGGFCTLSDNVTIHTRGTLLPHMTAGCSSVIGAGTVAIKNVKPNTTVFGVPGKQISF